MPMKALQHVSKVKESLSAQEKDQIIQKASRAYAAFMEALGIDYRKDPDTIDTPLRVAKAWVHDLASSCYTPYPQITTFCNTQGYEDPIFQGPIPVKSICSHHHSPFRGEAYIAYIPHREGKIIGLSKLNRIVEFYSRMPQIQETLTIQIWDAIDQSCCGNRGVACVINATHLCLCARGVNHHGCRTRTSKLSGDFIDNDQTRREFYNFTAINPDKSFS